MNNLIYIEKAKVVKVGEFATGNGNNGPWAMQPVKVEWEFPYMDSSQPTNPAAVRIGRMSAVVVCRGELATWARDNVKAGNPYANVPDMFLNLWLRLWGDFETVRRPDGRTWERVSNNIAAERAEIWQSE